MFKLSISTLFVRKALRYPIVNQSMQVVVFNNRRWLAQQVQRNTSSEATSRIEESKKITPMGWFLLLIPVTTFGLGCWQVKRKVWKEKLIKDLEEQTKIAAMPLPENLEDLNSMEYRLVKVKGKFLHEKEMYLGPRSLIRPDGGETAGGLFSQRDGGNGYLVITPFQLADRDDVVLVNRGWVSRKQLRPNTRMEGQIPQTVELTCVVRKGENRPQFTPEQKGEIFMYRDLSKMCNMSGALPVLLDAIFDSSVSGGPIGGQTRVTLRNEHLSYILTWFSLSAATAFLWYRQIIIRKPF